MSDMIYSSVLIQTPQVNFLKRAPLQPHGSECKPILQLYFYKANNDTKLLTRIKLLTENNTRRGYKLQISHEVKFHIVVLKTTYPKTSQPLEEGETQSQDTAQLLSILQHNTSRVFCISVLKIQDRNRTCMVYDCTEEQTMLSACIPHRQLTDTTKLTRHMRFPFSD